MKNIDTTLFFLFAVFVIFVFLIGYAVWHDNSQERYVNAYCDSQAMETIHFYRSGYFCLDESGGLHKIPDEAE